MNAKKRKPLQNFRAAAAVAKHAQRFASSGSAGKMLNLLNPEGFI